MMFQFELYFIDKEIGFLITVPGPKPGGGGTPYNGLYGEAPPERGTFLRLQVYERVGISLVEVSKRVGKSVVWVCDGPKGSG